MPLTIFHGEHHVKSRQALHEAIEALKQRQISIQLLEAKPLEPANLEHFLGSTSLFAEESGLQIEELHSLPKSERKSKLIEQLTQPIANELHVFMWEKKKLTPTELKKFPTAKIHSFPISSKMFAWINSLNSSSVESQLKLLNDAIQSDGADFCFAMFARQIRIWLEKTPDTSPQLKLLLDIHEELTFTDYKIKTGQSTLTLEQTLVQLVLKLNRK